MYSDAELYPAVETVEAEYSGSSSFRLTFAGACVVGGAIDPAGGRFGYAACGRCSAIAGRGTLFTNAHCPSSVCNPSRTAILTGMRPSRSGVYDNQQWWRPAHPEVVTLPERFRRAGFETPARRVDNITKPMSGRPCDNPVRATGYLVLRPAAIDSPPIRSNASGCRTRPRGAMELPTPRSAALFGRVLDALDESGLADNTLVVFLSDNGFHLGEKRHWHKSTLWERATHVPFVIAGPGLGTPGQRIDRPVSLQDLYPTLVDLCELPVADSERIDGDSLAPLIADPDRMWREAALTTYLRGNHALRTERWRYIRYHDGDELYDRDADPTEERNLATRPEMRPLITDAPMTPMPPTHR